MYVHSPNSKGNRNINIPYNYGGNAFRRESTPETKIHRAPPPPISVQREQDKPIFEEAEESIEPVGEEHESFDTDDKDISTVSVSKPTNDISKKNDLGVFGKLLGGIGSEELLLIALLLLISQGEKNDELSLMLLLLLFIK
ncbi:MAG: hypothetical protein J6Q78_03505 [Clostridia bacterium]|nr:hypothetical protein [Clostridia bacterium]